MALKAFSVLQVVSALPFFFSLIQLTVMGNAENLCLEKVFAIAHSIIFLFFPLKYLYVKSTILFFEAHLFRLLILCLELS